MAVCYRVVNLRSEEFSLSYSELSESCTIAELMNNLEPIVYKYNRSKLPRPPLHLGSMCTRHTNLGGMQVLRRCTHKV